MAKLRGNPWAVLVVVSLGFFMTLLDLTIVNIAIPDMINRLHASLDGVLWVLNAYALVLAVLVITAGMAMLTIVRSSSVMKKPSDTTTRTAHGFPRSLAIHPTIAHQRKDDRDISQF